MIRRFLESEVAGGVALLLAAMLAMVAANSAFAPLYGAAMHKPVFLGHSALHWINDGLMAVFFFHAGLEIKKEIVAGSLSSRSKALLPAAAAAGGMIVPAIIYVLFNINTGNPEQLNGWAIPSATDIAFALGVLALAGSRVPPSLKALLLAIAVIDDIGAILIIALFYGHGFNPTALLSAATVCVILYAMNRRGVENAAAYIVVAFLLWFLVLQSGVHATLAGVTAALFIPMNVKKTMMHRLAPWVAFGILPVFAFANAGVSLTGLGSDLLAGPVTLGIALGLFIGKQAGIFGVLWLMIKSGLAPKPEGASWAQLYGVSLLCGIGFTMALFIGGLALHGAEMQASVRMGVIMGSLLSGLAGFAVLRLSLPRQA